MSPAEREFRLIIPTREPDLGNASGGKTNGDEKPLPVQAAVFLFGKGGEQMPNVNVSLQVLPCVAEEDIYRVVDRVIALIQESGVRYEVGPMETTMEGDLDVLMEIVKKAQEICIKEGAARVVSLVKIDYKPEGVTIDEKIGKYR